MNADPSDSKLIQLLRRSHSSEAATNPTFKASVWRRIEKDRAPSTGWVGWLRGQAWPVFASALASLALAGWLGTQLGDLAQHRHRDELMNRYLASIDPHRGSEN